MGSSDAVMSWLDPTIPMLNIFQREWLRLRLEESSGAGPWGGKSKPPSIVPGGCGGAAAGRAGNFWGHVRRLKSLNGTGLVSVILLAFPRKCFFDWLDQAKAE